MINIFLQKKSYRMKDKFFRSINIKYYLTIQ